MQTDDAARKQARQLREALGGGQVVGVERVHDRCPVRETMTMKSRLE